MFKWVGKKNGTNKQVIVVEKDNDRFVKASVTHALHSVAVSRSSRK